jgi:hypothetical protein
VIVWEIPSGRPKLKLRTNGSAFRAIFSPDGSRLAVTDHEQVVFYPLQLEAPPPDMRSVLVEAEKQAGLALRGFSLELN